MSVTDAMLAVEKAARDLLDGSTRDVVANTDTLAEALDSLTRERERVETTTETLGADTVYEQTIDGFAYPEPSGA